jgi:hypothetical protein
MITAQSAVLPNTSCPFTPSSPTTDSHTLTADGLPDLGDDFGSGLSAIGKHRLAAFRKCGGKDCPKSPLRFGLTVTGNCRLVYNRAI